MTARRAYSAPARDAVAQAPAECQRSYETARAPQ
jgi:hypothetical protein